MTLEKRGQFRYGDAQADIREELVRYAKKNGYPAHHFVEAVCTCGGKTFRLAVDDNEGAAVRTCASCALAHPIGDSADYLEGATLEDCECPCGASTFELTAAVSLYEASEDVRWLYLACRCPSCTLIAAYADWKNESPNYRLFLTKI